MPVNITDRISLHTNESMVDAKDCLIDTLRYIFHIYREADSMATLVSLPSV